jgi:hypothetical protein
MLPTRVPVPSGSPPMLPMLMKRDNTLCLNTGIFCCSTCHGTQVACLTERSAGARAQTPVQALAFSPAGRWALSAADGERHVAIWPAAERERGGSGGRDKKDKKKRKAAAAAGLLALEEPAAALATAPAPDGAGDDACFQARPPVRACEGAGRGYSS